MSGAGGYRTLRVLRWGAPMGVQSGAFLAFPVRPWRPKIGLTRNARKVGPMYIAMNRFKIVKGEQAAFEDVWRTRETHLSDVPGFKDFKLLRGPDREDHTLYASHSIWQSEQHFTDWTKSEAFRLAHRNAGDNRPLYIGHPEFEGFQVVLASAD